MKIKLIRGSSTVPFYAHETDGAFDLLADIPEPIEIAPGEIRAIHTGIAISLTVNTVGLVLPRSGNAKRGLSVANSPGLIDAGYTGEIKVLAYNISRGMITVNPSDRIAQLMIVPFVKVDFEPVDKLDATPRGDGGFGSTGQ